MKIGNPLMCTMANSKDPDVKAHYVAFHQGLHCLLRTNQYPEKEILYFLEIITCVLIARKPVFGGFVNNTGQTSLRIRAF